jgi:hypothetical protein
VTTSLLPHLSLNTTPGLVLNSPHSLANARDEDEYADAGERCSCLASDAGHVLYMKRILLVPLEVVASPVRRPWRWGFIADVPTVVQVFL